MCDYILEQGSKSSGHLFVFKILKEFCGEEVYGTINLKGRLQPIKVILEININMGFDCYN